MLIDASHIKLTLNGQGILKDVSMHISRGEIYGLLGPNGAGKSTSIAVLLGLYVPDDGDLRLFSSEQGEPLALRRSVGVMPEHAGFYEWMSATDYLVWYASFYGGLQQQVSELLNLVGLRDRGDKPIGQFSHGMQQRLALARALVHAPELLILDEPTNGLDPRGRREIHDLLLRLAREREVGILLCTHLLDDVERLCNRIGIIDHGRTVAEGTLAELLGRGHTGMRYRLRMIEVPEEKVWPRGIKLRHRDGDWWHCEVPADAIAHLPGLWEDLIVHGWGLAEIHAEGGGLETLYLQLTTATDSQVNEQAA
jgi:ABC-2 type transport system ATP-binding protein